MTVTHSLRSTHACMRQVHPDGSQSHLWSTTTDDREEKALITVARRITSILVLMGAVLACTVSCRSQLGLGGGDGGSSRVPGGRQVEEEEEREVLRAED